jgi:hypothetical protein
MSKRIMDLKELKDQGIISEEEFIIGKGKILGK